jgi:hypothetical protein
MLQLWPCFAVATSLTLPLSSLPGHPDNLTAEGCTDCPHGPWACMGVADNYTARLRVLSASVLGFFPQTLSPDRAIV